MTCASCIHFKPDGRINSRSCSNRASPCFGWATPSHVCDHYRDEENHEVERFRPTAGVSKEEYAEYLQSEEWWERRTLVMERAAGLCEGCRKAEPVDVHHLTYTHVTCELLYELAALCASCHERAHGGQGDSPRAERRQRWPRRKTEGQRLRDRVKGAY